MRTMTFLASGLVVAAITIGHSQGAQPPSAAGQMKVDAVMQCPALQPTPVEVGDQPGHALAVAKIKCTYSKGEIAGVQIKEEEDTFVMDMTSARSSDRGYGVISLANGEKAFVQFQGSTMMKDNKPSTASGTWSFTGGTGKAKGITGKGTFKGTYKPDGAVSFDILGDYQIGAARGK